jgi:K+-sensing histidine kinase KdpD
MSEISQAAQAAEKDLHGAVIAAIIPDQPARVVTEAAHYANMLGVPLVVVHVDVTRFVTYEDPDGAPHTAPIDINVDAGAEELAEVQQRVSEALAKQDVEWTTVQLVGDPQTRFRRVVARVLHRIRRREALAPTAPAAPRGAAR